MLSLNSRYLDNWAHVSSLDIVDYNVHVINFEGEYSPHISAMTEIIAEISPNIHVHVYQGDIVESFNAILSNVLSQKTRSIFFCPFQITDPLIVDSVKEAYNLIKSHGCIIVCSCGNDGADAPWYFPATDPDSLVVGSHDRNGLISSFNSMSLDRRPDVFALGRRVHIPALDIEIDGTSAASAIVTASLCYYASVKEFLGNCNRDVLCWKDHAYTGYPNLSCFIGKRNDVDIDPPILEIQDGISFISNGTMYMDLTDHEHGELKDEYITVAKSIDSDDIIVPMSGGVDSEVVAQTMLMANREFTPVIMRYKMHGEYINEYDFKSAENFCNKHGLDILYLDLDILDFYESGKFMEYSEKYYCSSPQLCTHLWMMDKIDGFFVFPGDPVNVVDGIIAIQSFLYYCYDYYLHKTSKHGITRLFTHGSKIINATISHYDKLPPYSDRYVRKIEFFQMAGFDVEPRAKKYTGFEDLKTYLDEFHGVLRFYDHRFRTLNDRFNLPMTLSYAI